MAALRRELDPLVDKFRSAYAVGSAERLQDAWDTWTAWLKENQLQYLPGNRMVLDAWAEYGNKFRAANSNQTVSQWADRLVAAVSKTQLS